MIRKFKALGIAIGAVFAMSAMAASAAQAAPEFHVDKAPAIITAEQTLPVHVFTITNGVTVKCNTATFNGTTATTTFTTLTLKAAYSNCKLAGLAADVNMNSCDYLFHMTAALTAQVDVTNCAAGKPIEVSSTVTNCIVKVGNQNSLSHIVFTNTGSVTEEKDVDANITISEAGGTIAYEEVGSECPDPGAHTGGTYTGGATIRAYVETEAGGEGAQTALFAT
jgi:hypothetical protein